VLKTILSPWSGTQGNSAGKKKENLEAVREAEKRSRKS
jgi:hypothetical protein